MLCTGRPLAAIRMSPTRTPARAAGECSATSCAVTPSPCARHSTPSSSSDQVARIATFDTARQSKATTMAACAIRRSQVAWRLLAWGSRIDDTGIRREGSNWRSLAEPCPITLSPCSTIAFVPRAARSSKPPEPGFKKPEARQAIRTVALKRSQNRTRNPPTRRFGGRTTSSSSYTDAGSVGSRKRLRRPTSTSHFVPAKATGSA